MKKLLLVIACLISFNFFNVQTARAETDEPPVRGEISKATVAGSLLSLLVWPGIGQAINDEDSEKIVTHAVIGFFPPFRIWSAYDALYDRRGGYWDGKI
jgi:hypothetical protein